jgi:RNA polymerase sigma-70 factor, ECF subfamily
MRKNHFAEGHARQECAPSSANGSDATDVPTHAVLVARMADGDEAAAAALHDECYLLLLRTAYLIVREYADAEEVVSDAFTKAWRDSASFDETRGTVAGWLVMMVKSRARDLVRSRTRRESASDRAELAVASGDSTVSIGWMNSCDVVCGIEASELSAALLRVLHELPTVQREAIDLVFLQSTSHATAADRLGVPLGTVKTRVRLGLRRMRAVLQPTGARYTL